MATQQKDPKKFFDDLDWDLTFDVFEIKLSDPKTVRITVTRMDKEKWVEYQQRQKGGHVLHIDDEKGALVPGNVLNLAKYDILDCLRDKDKTFYLLKMCVPETDCVELFNFFNNFMAGAKALTVKATEFHLENLHPLLNKDENVLWPCLRAARSISCERLQITINGQVACRGSGEKKLEEITKELDRKVTVCTIISNEAISNNIKNAAAPKGFTVTCGENEDKNKITFTRIVDETPAKP